MRNVPIDAHNLPKFTQGYAFQQALLSQTDWINLPCPCRLVYKCSEAPSLIVLPFLIPAYKKQIVAIDINGVYFCTGDSLDRMCFDSKISTTLQKLSVELFGKEAASKRLLKLPTLNDLYLQKKYSSALRRIITMMQRHHIHTCSLLIGRKWVRVEGSDKPCVTYEIGNRFVEPYSDICSDLQPILTADNNTDYFCAVDEFGAPNMQALHKCLLQLSK